MASLLRKEFVSSCHRLPITMMKRRATFFPGLGAIIVLLVLLADSALYVHESRLVLEHQRMVLHTQEILAGLERVLLIMVDAETGQRGYLLTRDPPFLAPYTQAVIQVEPTLATLAVLTEGEARQRKQLATLRALIERRQSSLRQSLALAEAGDFAAAQAFVRSGIGKREMDAIRAQIAAMQDEERRTLRARTAQAEVQVYRAGWLFITLVALNLLLIGLVYVMNRRAIGRLEMAAEMQRRAIMRLEMLKQIDQALLEQQPVTTIGTVALRHLDALLPCEHGVIAQFDQGALKLLAHYPADSALPFASDEPSMQAVLAQEAFWRGETVVLREQSSLLALDEPQPSAASSDARIVGVPLCVQEDVVGCLLVRTCTTEALSPDVYRVAGEAAQRLAVALNYTGLVSHVHASRQQLQSLSQRLLQVQEAERAHLARELHDEIGQMLTGLNILLQSSAGELAQRPPGPLQQAQQVVVELLARVRTLSLDLRPPMLDTLGLLPTLRWHVERFQEQMGIAVQLQQRSLAQRFAPALELAAYRIVQEALTNVARHAQAQAVTVRLWVHDHTFSLQIEDNGRGFDVAAVQAGAASSGLTGMAERAALVGGAFTITAQPGQGTRITVDFPLAQRSAKPAREEQL